MVFRHNLMSTLLFSGSACSHGVAPSSFLDIDVYGTHTHQTSSPHSLDAFRNFFTAFVGDNDAVNLSDRGRTHVAGSITPATVIKSPNLLSWNYKAHDPGAQDLQVETKRCFHSPFLKFSASKPSNSFQN